jgi:hypothetical protein
MIKFKILIVFANADDLDEKKSQCGYTLCRGNDLRHSNKLKKTLLLHNNPLTWHAPRKW